VFTKACKPEIMRTLLPEDFPAEKLSRPQYKVVEEKDVFVTMRDGAKVAVDVFRPDAEGEFPVIYATSAYQKDLAYLPQVPAFHFRETNDIEWFVSRGYVYVHHDIRGSGKSTDGEWQFFSEPEQHDFYDVIEWAAAQPWANGNVGMIGESYLGWVQWFSAAQQPPHLKCIAPYDAGADMYRDVAYHGGIMSVGFPTAWHMWEIRANYRLGRFGPDPDQGRWDLPWHVINHPTCDEFWKLRSADFSKIECPVFSIGMLHKVGIHLRGNTRGYEQITTPKKLLLCHGDFEGDEMAIFNSTEMRQLLLRWYDHWLKGNDTGMLEEPPVTVFVRGREEYRPEAGWPLPRTDYRKLYLTAGPSGGVESLNDGGLSWEQPAVKDSSTSYSYPDPDWSHFSGIGTAVMENGVPNPVRKILTFATDPLPEDLEVIGSTVLVLYAASDQTDTDFFCRVTDQLPDAEQIPGLPPRGLMLTRGWLKASHACTRSEELSLPYRPYYLHDAPAPIEPGAIDRYEIEVWPTSCCFGKGHRLRIDLACYDSNAFDFGGHYYGLKVGTDTIYHDREHPSHILLPVISSE